MLTFGGLLLCSALLAFAALIAVFRRPDPPRWTTRAGVGELVTIALVTMLTFGLGFLTAGGIAIGEQGIDPVDLGSLAVVLAGSFLVWRRLGGLARLRLSERSSVASVTVLPLTGTEAGGTPGTTDPRPPSYPRERAA